MYSIYVYIHTNPYLLPFGSFLVSSPLVAKNTPLRTCHTCPIPCHHIDTVHGYLLAEPPSSGHHENFPYISALYIFIYCSLWIFISTLWLGFHPTLLTSWYRISTIANITDSYLNWVKIHEPPTIHKNGTITLFFHLNLVAMGHFVEWNFSPVSYRRWGSPAGPGEHGSHVTSLTS